MEQYNKVLKDVLDSNKLKHLVALEPIQQSELYDLEIYHLEFHNQYEDSQVLRIYIKSTKIKKLVLEIHNHPKPSPVLINIEGNLIPFTVSTLYFSEVDSSNEKQFNAFHDFFNDLFESMYFTVSNKSIHEAFY